MTERGAQDFFALLAQMEREGQRFGRSGGPASEPARLGQTARMTFAAGDVAHVQPAEDGAPPSVAVNVLGLLGPEGPMPLHLTRWIMERGSDRWFASDTNTASADRAFLDFCNMLQHRMIAYYWRAWADRQPDVQIRHGTGGTVAAAIRALAGVGLPESVPADRGAKLSHATSLARRVDGPQRLERYLCSESGLPIHVREFIPARTPIPMHLQTRLGRDNARLGASAVMGTRVFERASRAEIRVGPLSSPAYAGFVTSLAARERLRSATLFAAGQETAFDLRVTLAGLDAPAARLGHSALGRSAWLGRPRAQTVEDLCYRAFTHKSADPRP